MNKILIDGMKLSDPLILVHLRSTDPQGSPIGGLSGRLTENRINICFLSSAWTGDGARVSFCIPAQAGSRLMAVLDHDTGPRRDMDLIHEVGALSIFPHRYSFRILGLSLRAFAASRSPLHGMASSISSLTFLTDFSSLSRVATVMKDYLSGRPGPSFP